MLSLILAIAAAQASPAAPPRPAVPPPTAALPSDPAERDWRMIPDDELLVVTLAGSRTVVIRLAPAYAPEHVANVRRLALAHWWDGTSVYRVQDNWATQWGDQTEKKPLPAGIAPRPRPSSTRRSAFTRRSIWMPMPMQARPASPPMAGRSPARDGKARGPAPPRRG